MMLKAITDSSSEKSLIKLAQYFEGLYMIKDGILRAPLNIKRYSKE